MKNETLLFIIAIFAILVMGTIIALNMLYPSGLAQGAGPLYITLSASGSASATPQLATISVLMNGTGSTSAVAAANLSFTLAQFNSTIGPYISQNSSRITTQGYYVYKYNVSAYSATESVTVQLPSTQNVSAILGKLSLISNVYVQGINTQFSPSQVNALTQQALTAAMANATQQASILSPNKTLIVRNVTVSGFYRYYPLGLSANAASGSQNPLYFTGKQTLTETVTVVFSQK